MSMKSLFLAGAAVALLSTGALAAEPTKLTASQMDDVTAGVNVSLELAYARTRPIRSRNATTLDSLSVSSAASSNTLVSTPTSLSVVRAAAAGASNSYIGTAANSDGRLRAGGTSSFAGTGSFSN